MSDYPYHPPYMDEATAPTPACAAAILLLRRHGYTVTPPPTVLPSPIILPQPIVLPIPIIEETSHTPCLDTRKELR